MPKQKTLLEKALSINPVQKRISHITEEEIELALAWLQDEVSFTQVGKALDLNSTMVYTKLSLSIREAFRSGALKFKS